MTALPHPSHPVTQVVADVRSELSSVAGTPVWSMSPDETTATLADVGALAAQVAELQARLLSHAERIDLPGTIGAASIANWHAHTSKTTQATARRTMRLANALDTYDLTRTALAEGRVHAEQAEVILRALAELPDDLDPDVITKAETYLLKEAADHDAKALRIMGRHLLEVIDPDLADEHEARLLEREEREAAEAVRLSYWTDTQGRLQGRFTLDPLTGAMFTTAIRGFAARRHRAAKGPLGDVKPTPKLLGEALVEMIERYPVNKLPKSGGINATVVVTMTLETLEGRLKAAHLDTGLVISPGAARRLACNARIIPAVLGGKSQVLDLGRASRFATEGQRIAKAIETGGCETDGCQEPPARTDLHHQTRWADGGKTDLAELIALCEWHHHRAHDTRYVMTRAPNGRINFHRRT